MIPKMSSSIYETAVKHEQLKKELQLIFTTVINGLNLCTLAHRVKYTSSLNPLQGTGKSHLGHVRHEPAARNIFRRPPREEGTPFDSSSFLWTVDDILSDVDSNSEKIKFSKEILSNTVSMRATVTFYDSWTFRSDFEIDDMRITDESIYRHRPELQGTAMLRFVDPRIGKSEPLFRFVMLPTDRFLMFDSSMGCWVFQELPVKTDLDAWISSFKLVRLADDTKIRIPLQLDKPYIDELNKFANFPTIFATVEYHGKDAVGTKGIGMDDILKSLLAPESVSVLDEIQRQLGIYDEFRKLKSEIK